MSIAPLTAKVGEPNHAMPLHRAVGVGIGRAGSGRAGAGFCEVPGAMDAGPGRTVPTAASRPSGTRDYRNW